MGEFDRSSVIQAISQLSSIDSIAEFVNKLSKKTDIKALNMPAILLKAIVFYEKSKDYETAANISEKAGFADLAIRNYLKIFENEFKRTEYKNYNWYERAGDAAFNAGNIKKARELYTPYILDRSRTGWTNYAVGTAVKVGLNKLAISVLERVGDKYQSDYGYSSWVNEYEAAMKLADELGEKEEVLRLKDKIITSLLWHLPKTHMRTVAYHAEKYGLENAKKAWYMAVWDEFENKNNFDYAIRTALEKGFIDDAIQMNVRLLRFEEAVEIALSHGMKDRAKELYTTAMLRKEKFGNYKEARQIAEKAGFDEKARLYSSLESIMQN